MFIFTCSHCEKPILGLNVVVDESHIVHTNCKDTFLENQKNSEELKIETKLDESPEDHPSDFIEMNF